MSCELRPVYGPKNDNNPGWTGGARSIVSFSADCYFGWSVTLGSVGVVAGLNNQDNGPAHTEIQHGYHFQRGTWRIIEGGVIKSPYSTPYADGDRFFVIRRGTDVIYCKRDAGAAELSYVLDYRYPGVQFPGPILYVSTVPSHYTVFLDASFYTVGDQAYNEVAGVNWYPTEAETTPTSEPSGAHIEQQMFVFGAGRSEYETPLTAMGNISLPLDAEGTGTGQSGAAISLGFDVFGADDLVGGIGRVDLPFAVAADGAGTGMYTQLSGVNAVLGFAVDAGGGERSQGAAISLPMYVFGHGTDDVQTPITSLGQVAIPFAIDALGSAFVASNGFQINLQFGGPSLAVFEDEIEDGILVGSETAIGYANLVAENLTVAALTETFTQTAIELTEAVLASTGLFGDFEGEYAESLSVADTVTFQLVALLAENILATSDFELGYQTLVEILSNILVADSNYAERSVSLAETIELLGSAEVNRRLLAQAVAAMTVADTVTTTLTIVVTETAEFTAADSIELSKSLLANILEDVNVYALFRVSDEIAQGWVMNTEGANPISEYDNFNFNSLTFYKDTMYSAGDEGIYTHGANDDAGEAITAELASMLLDFGTSRMKRIRSAYMGYTSENELVLKVRSVSQGVMTEDWFQATQTTTADSPDGSYMHVGQGLKSRYWQFELTNIDGGDFEIDQIELHPLILNRRV